VFHSHSDTEVILYAYRQWGTDCLNRFNGMWAFALWDADKKRLFCARDRFGCKPFYYFFNGKHFIFGSEIKQLLFDKTDHSLNEDAIYYSFKIPSYLINEQSTFFRHIHALPHSHYIIIQNGHFKIERYYNLNPETFGSCKLAFPDATEKYRELLKDAVSLRQRCDVELGISLSGGLDSTAILALAAADGNKVKAFSAYFTEAPQYDERYWINQVTKEYPVQQFYVSPSASDMMNDLPAATWLYDYPVTGSSYLAQYYVMKAARENGVTVILDGQGNDEIAGGYYHAFYRYYAHLLKSGRICRFISEFPSYLAKNPKGSAISKMAKTAAVLLMTESEVYRQEIKRNVKTPLRMRHNGSDPSIAIKDLKTDKLSNFLYNLTMACSIQTELHFVDRNSMAHSVEAREPFLDYRLVEFMFTMPPEFKVHKHLGKYIHRKAFEGMIPDEIIHRKEKVGFSAPCEYYWLNTQMKGFFEDIMNSPEYLKRGIYDYQWVRSAYKSLLEGKTDHAKSLWQIMAQEIWFRVFKC
jgi:asparagine synthase (glutamine-hydrolysing)